MEQKIHFIGAGGVGVAGLAHLAADLGMEVTGSDVADSAMLRSLQKRGISTWLGHSPERMGSPELVVYSAAVPENDPERVFAREHGIPEMRRGAFQNRLALAFPVRVAISGSHGKTSTTAMLAHILRETGREPAYLVGGIVNGWERSAAAGARKNFVTEVDESDASQSDFPATLAIVLNVDDDHCWGLGGTAALEQTFLDLCRPASNILAWHSPTTERLFATDSRTVFLETPLAASPELPLHGWQFRQDGAVAIAAAVQLGVPETNALAALRTFPGVSRRMTERARSADGARVLVEDYAHHPTELRATLDSLRETYPGRRILVVFQPHRMERIERYGEQFAQLLSSTDWCGLVEPFGAWRTDGHRADARSLIAEHVTAPCVCLPNDPRSIANAATPVWLDGSPAVLAVIGAGDVTQAVPLLQKNVEK